MADGNPSELQSPLQEELVRYGKYMSTRRYDSTAQSPEQWYDMHKLSGFIDSETVKLEEFIEGAEPFYAKNRKSKALKEKFDKMVREGKKEFFENTYIGGASADSTGS